MEIETRSANERLNQLVAITVVIVSVFMAVSKVKDDNIVQAMQYAQMSAVDAWNEYQAQRIKLHTDENDAAALELRSGIAGADAAGIQAEAKRLEGGVAKYKTQSAALMKEARDDEARYNSLNYRDDQFDMSDAFLSTCLALAAVAALTSNTILLFISWGAGGFGLLMGLAGFFGWPIHPELLAAFLS